MNKVRTRYAPSPTGFLHLGGLRTALYCYALAKQHNGVFILRIEDTDQARFVEGAIKQIIESLKWAGITPDEGVVDEINNEIKEKGDLGPYVQSQRIELYKKYAQQLLSEKKAYKCFCTPQRLDDMRSVQRAAKQMPKYDRHCLNLTKEELQTLEDKNSSYVIRFLVPDGGDVVWDDKVFGKMSFIRDQVDDFIMIKVDGFPTYNYANVVDDHTMEISQIIRGQEFLSSTPKHVLLYQAFGWEAPQIAHVPWILGKNKQKLSKREGDVAVDNYREKGVLPEAMCNYLALLGWSPKNDSEIFSLDEFIKLFQFNDVQKSGAVFDMDKLEWMNGEYIRNLSPEQLYRISKPFLPQIDMDESQITAILRLEQPRIKLLADIPAKIAVYTQKDLAYDINLLNWKKNSLQDTQTMLKIIAQKLTELDDWNKNAIQEKLYEIAKETGKGNGDVFWPTRVALTGLDKSPGPHEVAEVLGKSETLSRIEKAVQTNQYNL